MARDRTLPQDFDSPPRTVHVPPAPERVVHYPGMAQVAAATIQTVLDRSMTAELLIVWCEEAEGRWPRIGWREVAETLRRRPRGKHQVGGPGRIREARALLQAWEAVPWTSQQRSREELARQKAAILGMDGQPAAEEVPF